MTEAENLGIILMRKEMIKIYTLFPSFEKYLFLYICLWFFILAANSKLKNLILKFNFYLECV